MLLGCQLVNDGWKWKVERSTQFSKLFAKVHFGVFFKNELSISLKSALGGGKERKNSKQKVRKRERKC